MAMRNALLLGGLGGLIALLTTNPALSCIAMPMEPRHGTQPASITLDRQSAFLWQGKGQQHMLLSVKYSGTSDQFAWVIPVESRPKVTVEKGAPFTELRRLTEVEKPTLRAPQVAMAPAGASPPSVTVLERKEEGPYDIAVLSATSDGGLFEWLKANRFHVSKNARGQLSYYVDRKYVFVAARIRNSAQDNQTVAQRLKEGTIAPMHLAYPAKHLTYPLKVTSGNPGTSDMEIYVAGPVQPHRAREKHDPFAGNDTGMKQETFRLTPNGTSGFKIAGPPGTVHSQGDFPTLRRLISSGGELHKFTARLSDSQRQEDLVFAKL